jgi:hypothetical protein
MKAVKSSFSETELIETDGIFFFTAKVRVVSFFCYFNRWVSLKARDFMNLKFPQIINCTT